MSPQSREPCEFWSETGTPPPFCSEAVFNHLPMAVIAINAQAEVIFWNPAAEELFGWSCAAVQGTFLPIIPEDQVAQFREHLADEIAGAARIDKHAIRQCKDGRLIDVRLSTAPLKTSDGRTYGSIGFFVDITDKIRAQEEFRAASRLHEAVFSNMDQAVLVIDPADRRILRANPAVETVFGYTPDELVGQNTLLLHKDRAAYDAWAGEGDEELNRRGIYQTEGRLRRKDGTLFWAEVTVTPIHPTDGWPKGVISVIRDVTERKQSEMALQESNQTLQTIFDTSQSGIIKVDHTGIVRLANQAMAEMFRFPVEELVGKPYLDLLHPRERKAGEERMLRLIRGELQRVAVERCYRRADGSSFWGYLTGQQLQTPRGEFDALIGVITDISALKEYSLTVEAQKQFLNDLINHIPLAVFWKDRQRVYQGCNRAFARIAALKEPSEIIGKTDYDLPLSAAEAEYFRQCDQIVMNDDQPMLNTEERVSQTNGRKLTLLTSKVPLHDASGRVEGMLGIFSDITEQKRIAEDLETKNRELERFVYTVSHDLKSPLVTIKTFLNLFAENIAAGQTEQILTDMDYMQKAADKMEGLLNDLLQISRIGRMTGASERFSVLEAVAEARETVAGALQNRGVKVVTTLEPVVLQGDRTRLTQIFENLIDNAVKYMGETPDPVIEIGLGRTEEEIIFHVCDNGIGIGEPYRAKVFEIFEKLDPESEGSGLGLALTKRIVELYRGRIWIEPRDSQQGTCFRFTLPEAIAKLPS